MLNETNPIDVESTTCKNMWFPMFERIFEGCEC